MTLTLMPTRECLTPQAHSEDTTSDISLNSPPHSVSTLSLPPDEQPPPAPTRTRSKKFFWEFVNFVVGEEEYQVPRFLFEGSPILELPRDGEDNIILNGIATNEFDSLLSVMYPTIQLSATNPSFSLGEWESVLKLSSMYKLYDIRELAIKQMKFFLSSHRASFLNLGKEFGIPDWIRDSAIELVNAEEFFETDHRKLGLEITVHIYKLREKRFRKLIGTYGYAYSIDHAVEMEFSSHLARAKELSVPLSRPEPPDSPRPIPAQSSAIFQDDVFGGITDEKLENHDIEESEVPPLAPSLTKKQKRERMRRRLI